MPLRTPGPDLAEKGIRLGCGGLLGLALAVAGALQFGPDLPAHLWLLLGLSIPLCALLALRYGDRFWRALADWASGLWPW